jgi:tetratricopeptide (TPR) repeat protein
MQGLRALYSHTGRKAEWARLVEEVVPLFVDPVTDGPLPGREAEWSVVTQFRVYVATDGRQWEKAEGLQRAQIVWQRERVDPVLVERGEDLSPPERNAVRRLAVSLNHLALVLREQGNAQCKAAYDEAIDLYRRIDDKSGQAIATYNLGVAYKNLPQLRDLERAEQEFLRSLELRDETDNLGRSKCLVGLGNIAYERFLQAQTESITESKRNHKLNESLHFAQKALSLIPPNAPNDLAITHHNLGLMYAQLGDWENASSHYRQAIQHFEVIGDLYSAAQTRYNVAVGLTHAGSFQDAMDYARAALGAFSNIRAAGETVQRTEKLIQTIQESLLHGEGVRK